MTATVDRMSGRHVTLDIDSQTLAPDAQAAAAVGRGVRHLLRPFDERVHLSEAHHRARRHALRPQHGAATCCPGPHPEPFFTLLDE